RTLRYLLSLHDALPLPLRFILRVRATRAASSCVLVIQARSRVCKPNSPKSILRLREAVPLRLPRWDFRYFTRFGINGITMLLKLDRKSTRLNSSHQIIS